MKRISNHQTELSKHRTELSKHRIGLPKHPTDLQKPNSKWSRHILFLLLIFGVAAPSFALAQTSEQAIFKIIYEFKHVEDTTMPERPILEDMFLYVNETTSLYRRSVEESSEKAGFKFNGGKEEDFDLNTILPNTASLYHSNVSKLQINTHRVGPVMYQVRNALPSLAWEIQDEQKTLGGFSVQKATVTYGGRAYEAWFTTEIPIAAGPWKLQGLPGLILEAKDAKEEVVFAFKEIEKIDYSVKILYPEGIKQLSDQEFGRFYVAFRENPMAFYQAVSGPGTTVVVGSAGRRAAGATQRSREYNNPIELDIKQ